MCIDSNIEHRLTFYMSCHRANRLNPTRQIIGFDNLSFVRIETSKLLTRICDLTYGNNTPSVE